MNTREFVRIDHEMLVQYDRYNADEQHDDEGVARAVDISEHGILLQLPRAPEVGAKLQLEFQIDGQEVDLIGHVAWVKPAGDLFDVGVQLAYVSDRYLNAVEKMLEQSS